MSRIMRMLALGLAMTVGLTVTGVTTAVADVGDPTIAYGSVTESDSGDALTGLQVLVYDVDPTTLDAEPVATAATPPTDPGLEGDYQVTLAPGSYWFVASADDHKALTFQEDVADTSGAYQNLGGQYLDINTGKLSGIVNGNDGGYNCAYVEIYQADGDPENGPYSSTYTGQLETNGAYTRELPIGTYKVRVSDDCGNGYVSVWVGGDNSFANATPFTVASEATETVTTVQLDDGAVVSGVVRKGLTTAPLDAISVTLKTADGIDAIDSDTTDANGAYSFGHVAPGTYQLQFSDNLGEYDPATVDNITVTSLDKTVDPVGMTVTPPGTDTNLLKGKVTGPTKAGIGNINVYVVGTDIDYETNVHTKRDGTYSVNVVAGSYKVYFSEYNPESISAFGFGGNVYQPEWFDNAPTYNKAKTVVVGAAAVTANAELTKYAVISGKVSAPAGFQLDGNVSVYNIDGEQVAGTSVDEEDGTYRIDGLVPGSYKIKANGWAFDEDFYFPLIRQYYSGKYTLSSANAIAAGNGAVITGRNITLSDKLSAYSAPKVSGSAKKGKTLTASAGAWTLTVDTEYTYQWYRGSSKLSGQTKRTHKVTSSDVGKKLRVIVTGSNRYDDYAPGTAASAFTKAVKKK